MKNNIEEISIDKIHPSPWQPRKTFDQEKLKAMGDSIVSQGIIAPIVVRKDKNDPTGYELIVGERRWRAWKFTYNGTIPAIIKDVDDFTAREMSFVENFQREDLTDPEKETAFYDLYMDGKKAGRYKSHRDIERKIGVRQSTVSIYIDAHNTRNKLKNDYIRTAVSTSDLQFTAMLRETPEAREELLKFRVEYPKKLTCTAMREVVRAINIMPTDKQSEIIDLLCTLKLEAKNVPQFAKVLKESPPDIQEKLINQEITIAEAETVNIFETPEQREQVIRERKGAEKRFESQKEHDLNVRKRQAERLKEGDPEFIRLQDIANWRKKYPSEHRELGEALFVEKCQKLFMDSIFYNPDYILQMVNKERQNECIEIGKRLSTLFSQDMYFIQQKMLVSTETPKQPKRMVMIA